MTILVFQQGNLLAHLLDAYARPCIMKTPSSQSPAALSQQLRAQYEHGECVTATKCVISTLAAANHAPKAQETLVANLLVSCLID